MTSPRRTLLWQSGFWLATLGFTLAGCDRMPERPLSEPSQTGGKPMKLSSAVFEPNGFLSSKYTCDGQDVSPPLRWNAVPEGTQSLALIVDDPDAPRGTFVHWVLYNLPPDLQELPEGIPNHPELENGSTQGESDFNKLGYGGPCPPSGTHRYFFKLYALNTRLNLKPGATKNQLLEAMEGHILAEAELIGRYARKR